MTHNVMTLESYVIMRLVTENQNYTSLSQVEAILSLGADCFGFEFAR